MPINVSVEQGFIVAIDLPEMPVKLADAPRLGLKIERMRLSQYEVPDVLWRHMVTKTGLYSATSPREIMENVALFRAENVAHLLNGACAKDSWLPYGFAVTPTTLRIDYYYVRDPKKCGFTELGRDFNQLWATFEAPGNQAKVLLSSNTYRTFSDWSHFTSPVQPEQNLQWDVSITRHMTTESRLLRRPKAFARGDAGIRCYVEGDKTNSIYSCTLSGNDEDSSHADDVDPQDAMRPKEAP